VFPLPYGLVAFASWTFVFPLGSSPLLAVRLQEGGRRVQVEAFLEIGRYASTDARVAGDVLEAIGRIAEAAAAVKARERVALLTAVAAAVAGPAIERADRSRPRTAR
jgi:hypothetical protein